MAQIAAIRVMKMQSNMKIGDREKDKSGREGGRERPEREGVWERRMGYGREGRGTNQKKRENKKGKLGKRGSGGNSMITLFTYIALQ